MAFALTFAQCERALTIKIKMVPSQAVHREYYFMFYRDFKLLFKFTCANVR